jgi:hypothetical protein
MPRGRLHESSYMSGATRPVDAAPRHEKPSERGIERVRVVDRDANREGRIVLYARLAELGLPLCCGRPRVGLGANR